MLPKPDKENYNTVKSYRPITLESTIGKNFQRTIAYRLRWKLEVSNGIAKTQDAYRKQHSCVQSVVRVINQLHEAKARKDYSVVLIMDFESCFEKVWRSGLLWKAMKKGINGRMLMFLHNYVTDRKYSLRVNEEKSDWVVSSVGIPQGSVLSPLLRNLYTSDSMDGLSSNHSEYADDNTVWKSGDNLDVLVQEVSEDGEKIAEEWCESWNMEISTVKTKAMIVLPDNVDTPVCDIKLKGESIEIVKETKLLGKTIDDQLKFEEHIADRKLKGFKAIKGIDFLI